MLFLTVPYAEKDDAKALGARWNPTKRRWYVPDGVATDAFAKWAAQGADTGTQAGAPAQNCAASGKRVDSYQGKTVVGTNYVALNHDCNPFEDCAQCAAALAGTGWQKARQHLAGLVATL